SSRVRKGNAYARLGQWEQAEREWQEAADVHPWNRAAWHNLSMAAVAKEDFQLARDRLTHAETRWIPGDQTAKSAAWIDSIERQHEACFDPANPSSSGQPIFVPVNFEGSKIGAPPRMPPNPEFKPMQDGQNTTSVKPRSLDDQPWYTMIPFMPPPGWSWSNWWYQSTLF
ncbi:MAG: tetratricopeptide repeat protein, partial [Pirellula sp.]